MGANMFFNTELKSDSFLENFGNFCLSPVRALCDGHTYEIIGNVPTDVTPSSPCLLKKIGVIALSILFLIPGILIGTIAKSLSLLSQRVRDNNAALSQSIANNKKDPGKSSESDKLLDSTESSESTKSVELVSERQYGHIKVTLEKGDITKQTTDAIVNAAKTSLLGGAGVDGAVHAAAGKALLEECKNLPMDASGHRCPTGQARITKGHNLPAKHIIHTVGPIWQSGTLNEEVLLKACYANSIKLAVDNKLASIAFPSISTGIYGYPLDKAATAALASIQEVAKTLPPESAIDVKFILFWDKDFSAYQKALNEK